MDGLSAGLYREGGAGGSAPDSGPDGGQGGGSSDDDSGNALPDALSSSDGSPEASNGEPSDGADAGSEPGPTPSYTWTFATDAQGWAPNYAVPASLMNDDAGTLSQWDGTEGSPDPGSIKLTIPFSGPNQQFDVSMPVTIPSLAGCTFSARLRAEAVGPDAGAVPAMVQIAIKSGSDYAWGGSNWTTLDPSAGWISINVNASFPEGYQSPGYAPTDIRQLLLHFGTASAGPFQTVVVYIDTIGYQ